MVTTVVSSMASANEDPVVAETNATLHEWYQIWISLYLDNNSELFERIGNLILNLIETRIELVQLLQKQLTSHKSAHVESIGQERLINDFKAEIIAKLDLGNRLLGLDFVLRDPSYRPVDPVELSPIKLYKLHTEAADNETHSQAGSCTNNISQPNQAIYQESLASTTGSTYYTASHNDCSTAGGGQSSCHNPCHLQLIIKKHQFYSLPTDELFEIYFSVVNLANSSVVQSCSINHLTEKFLVQFRGDDLICGVTNTIFTEIGPISGKDQIGILVQAFRVGRMTFSDGFKNNYSRQQGSNNQIGGGSHDGSSDTAINSITSKSTLSSISKNRHSTVGGFFSQFPTYRRPFGTTFIPLKEYISKGNSLFRETCITTKIFATSNETEFSQINEIQHRKNPIKVNHNVSNIQLDLSLRFLICPQDSIDKLCTENPYCLTEKRGFPNIVMPGDFKNDLYVTLEGAEFEKGGKSISKNIEASISLIDKSGLVIDECISPASNCDKLSCFKSYVFYHSNSPRWNESFKIHVPLTEFDSAHIRIEFRHCSTKDRDKKFLGFAFLPLSDENGAVVQDQSHELFLYKCDAQMWEDESLNLCKYTSLPYGPAAKPSGTIRTISSFTHSNRENVTISTSLLSTKLTQNKNLLNLLRWRELVKRDNKDFEEALKKALELKGEEVVKFLQDILDTLFDTFTIYSSSEDDYSALIFKVLVHIFLLLDEPKYQHFKPVLDTYVSAHFSATLVHKGLLACVEKCVEYSRMIERHAPIQRCFKSIKYVFQFIVQSKLLYSRATGEQIDDLFLNDLRHLFKLFEQMLADVNPKLIQIQEAFLQSFPETLESLAKVLNPMEIVRIVTSLAGSVGFRLPPPLLRAKLIFMRKTAISSLVRNQDVRLQITENFCRHLDCYIKHSEELELCHEVLEILVVKVHDYHWPSTYRMYQLTVKPNSATGTRGETVMTIGEICAFSDNCQSQPGPFESALISVAKELEPFVNLLEPILQLLDKLVQDFNSDRMMIQKYCTCLLTILKLMGKSSFEQFMNRRQLEYSKLCNLFKSLRAAYDRDWSMMQLTSHAILENPINEISKVIRNESHHTNVRQLTSYINLIVDFITHPTLQLESFSTRKRALILNIFGDLRLKFSNQLIKFWTGLSKSNMSDLTSTCIQPVLDAALLPNDEIQSKLIPIFWDMIDAEDQMKSNLRQIERFFIDNLDLFMNLDRGDMKFVQNFGRILKNNMRERAPSWEARGNQLIKSLTRLMQLLIDYRQALENFDCQSKQMTCLVNLLNFHKDQERMDIYLKYLFKLCDMHIESGNMTEAALTLKLYADELRWCNRSLNSLDGFRPEEQEWRRKELLYQKIIHHFDLGKCWEESIGLCKELASFYENYLVDYERVSNTLKKLAQYLDNILTEHRPEREYFRVEFIGNNFPEFVRGKEFIYRGGEYERLAAFIQRITSEFPNSQVLNAKSKQTLTKENNQKQYLIISNVKPVPFLQDHFKSGQRIINDKVLQYYLNNRVDTFSYDMPLVKGSVPASKDKQASTGSASGEVNVKNLWIGRYILKTRKQLPDILPWTEVISQEYIEISPINHAIETISSMNLELSKLILSYKSEPNKPVSPLTMRLQGVIEAAVNGGPAVIVNAFFKAPNEQQMDAQQQQQQQPDHELLVKLRDLIKQQYSILETGLGLHSKLAPPEVMPLHARLVERLQVTRETMLEETSQIENNYEVLNHGPAPIARCDGKEACDVSATPMNHSEVPMVRVTSSASGVDEVDGHDLNGNVYGELEDQIYSQPGESHLQHAHFNHSQNRAAALLNGGAKSNGSKSELSSPSRPYTTATNSSAASSSLSTLTVLSNLSVNRSRVSLTPSKEITATIHRDPRQSPISTAALCSKAARRLTYETTRKSLDMSKAHLVDQISSIKSAASSRLPQSSTKLAPVVLGQKLSGAKDDEAPPLPPRSSVSERQPVAVASKQVVSSLPATNHRLGQQQQQPQIQSPRTTQPAANGNNRL